MNGYGPLLARLDRLGYGIREQVLDAVQFGVPQTRRRLFILAEANHQVPAPIRPLSLPEIPVKDILDYKVATGEDQYTSQPLYTPTRAKPTVERYKQGVQALGGGVPFLIVYYGSDANGGWQSIDRPLRTLTTLDRFGLVTWKWKKPFLRMLQVPEICRAMGWNDDIPFRLAGTRRDKIMQMGNGVCPPLMRSVVEQLTASQNPVRSRPLEGFPEQVYLPCIDMR